MRKHISKILIAVITSVILSAGTWAFTVNARVAVVEERTDGIKERLDRIEWKLDRALERK